MELGAPFTLLNVPVDGFEVVHAELVVFTEMLLAHCKDYMSSWLASCQHIVEAPGREKVCSQTSSTGDKVKSPPVAHRNTLLARNEDLDVFVNPLLEQGLPFWYAAFLPVDFCKALFDQEMSDLTIAGTEVKNLWTRVTLLNIFAHSINNGLHTPRWLTVRSSFFFCGGRMKTGILDQSWRVVCLDIQMARQLFRESWHCRSRKKSAVCLSRWAWRSLHLSSLPCDRSYTNEGCWEESHVSEGREDARQSWQEWESTFVGWLGSHRRRNELVWNHPDVVRL